MSHEHFMHRCLQLAGKGQGKTLSNPMVGAVIVSGTGLIIGEGYHRYFGGPHAEVEAIQSVSQPVDFSTCTIYVNLEPCSHFGKTPPCADMLARHNFKTVVIGTTDPNPSVSGKGIQKLKQAGVEVITGVLSSECRRLNRRFFTYIEKQRPFVILKWAQTKNGYISREFQQTENWKEQNWITSKTTRSLTHQWRAEEQAILAGFNTILHDNPHLTCRNYHGNDPLRVILDRYHALPPESNVFKDDNYLIVSQSDTSQEGRIINITWDADFLRNLLNELYKKGIASILVEGGKKTLQMFLNTGLWDEARVLTGTNEFATGILAPDVRHHPTRVEDFDTDVITIYSNDLPAS